MSEPVESFRVEPVEKPEPVEPDAVAAAALDDACYVEQPEAKPTLGVPSPQVEAQPPTYKRTAGNN